MRIWWWAAQWAVQGKELIGGVKTGLLLDLASSFISILLCQFLPLPAVLESCKKSQSSRSDQPTPGLHSILLQIKLKCSRPSYLTRSGSCQRMCKLNHQLFLCSIVLLSYCCICKPDHEACRAYITAVSDDLLHILATITIRSCLLHLSFFSRAFLNIQILIRSFIRLNW